MSPDSQTNPKDEQALRVMMLRYLAGTLAPAAVGTLNQALLRRPELRREFAELLVQQVQLQSLRQEVLGQATPLPRARVAVPARTRRPAQRLGWLAAAAVLVLCVALWAVLRGGYPAPRVEGEVSVAGGKVERGATLSTGAQTGALTLGGYCRVEMAPHTELRVQGGERCEEVALARGKVVCAVASGVGTFDVHTPLGIVAVHGTEFSVELLKKKGGAEMKSSVASGLAAMVVMVMAGNVEVQFGGKSYALAGGQRQVFAAEAETPAPASGTLTGVVVRKEAAWIEVRPAAGGDAERYTPRWVGGAPGQGGGYDKDMLRVIAALRPGDRVALKWARDERLRVVALEKVGGGTEITSSTTPAAAGKIEAGAPEYAARDGEAWRERGRIVVPMQHAPAAAIRLLQGDKVVQEKRLHAGVRGVELERLAPGTYAMRVAAEGYAPLAIDGLQVKARNDLVVSLTFVGGPAAHEGEGRHEPAAESDRIAGFSGVLIGTVKQKLDNGIVVEVAEAAKIWPRSTVKHADAMVGKTVTLINARDRFPRPAERIAATLREIKVGDRVQVGAMPMEGDRYAIAEMLKRVGEHKD